MRKPVRSVLLACVVMALWTPAAMAQEEPESVENARYEETRERGEEDFGLPPHLRIPESLAEMIDAVLHRNPGIRSAEAELNQIRLRAVQELTELHGRREQLWETAAILEGMLEAAEGSPPQPLEAFELRQGLADARASVAELEAQLRYELGIGAPMEMQGHEPVDTIPMVPQARRDTEAPESLRQVLQVPISIEFDDVELHEIFRFMSDSWDFNIVADVVVGAEKVRYLSIKDVTLREALRAFANQCEICFVLKDYGIFATSHERAMRIPGATIPEGIPLLVREEGLFRSP